MAFVVLGLGSNRAWNGMDCIALLRATCAALSPLLADMRVSSVYCTKPMYVEAQDDFYNMAACGFVSDALTPHALLAEIHRIEAALGRDRSREIRNGPRSIDIDIELYGDARVESADLQIPHPRLAERAFVLVPLLELLESAPDGEKRIAPQQRAQIKLALHELPQGEASGVQLHLASADFLAITAPVV